MAKQSNGVAASYPRANGGLTDASPPPPYLDAADLISDSTNTSVNGHRSPTLAWSGRSSQIDLTKSHAILPPSSSSAFLHSQRYASRTTHFFDILVVGAGIMGCALAFSLHRSGRSVLLLERDLREPNRIVGELLQPGGVQALEALGLRECLEDIDAVDCKGYLVSYHGEPVEVPYPDPERNVGRSFHHGRFVQRLREACWKEGVTMVQSVAVDFELDPKSGRVIGVRGKNMESKEEEHYWAKQVLIADGNASSFRTHLDMGVPLARSWFVGLILHNITLPAPKHGHVVLGDNAPVLLYQIGANETRILVDMPGGRPSRAAIIEYIKTKTYFDVPVSVRPALLEALKTQEPRSMPNSWMAAKRNLRPGASLLGDAANMRHPLTGGGMTVALQDCVLLSRLLSGDDLEDDAAVRRKMRRFWIERKKYSSTINILAQALYSLFAADIQTLKALQMGCFMYFRRGGKCVSEPVGLLAGIIKQPFVLYMHFFAVAFYSIWLTVKPLPFYLWPWGMYMAIAILYRACVVIVPYMYSEWYFNPW